jgi:hypothetical protein
MELVQQASPFDRDDWLYEVKHDGFRAVAYIENGLCKLVSRHDFNYKRFRDVAAHWVANGFNRSSSHGTTTRSSGTMEPLRPVETKAPYFTRLWRGEIGLAVTFWIWGFLVFAVFRVVDVTVELNAVAVAKFIGWYYVFMAVSLAYSVFAWVAIWRSASRSTAKAGPGLAQLWVVLGILGSAVAYGALYNDLAKKVSESDVAAMALELSRSLPTKLDEVTVLEKVSARGKTITYRYGITGELDMNLMKNTLVSGLCADEAQVKLLRSDVLMEYTYHGVDREFGTIAISKKDCPSG